VGEVVCVKFLDTPFVVACAFVWGILKIKCTKGGFYFINKTGNGSFCCLLKHSPTQQQQWQQQQQRGIFLCSMLSEQNAPLPHPADFAMSFDALQENI